MLANVLRHLIWVCTVCLGPKNGTLGKTGLRTILLCNKMLFRKEYVHLALILGPNLNPKMDVAFHLFQSRRLKTIKWQLNPTKFSKVRIGYLLSIKQDISRFSHLLLGIKMIFFLH